MHLILNVKIIHDMYEKVTSARTMWKVAKFQDGDQLKKKEFEDGVGLYQVFP